MSANTSSINKILSIFRDMSIRHKMINDFFVGEPSDVSASRPLKFPYLWVDYGKSIISGSIGSAAQTITYEFKIAVMDKIKKGDSNYEDTLSDTQYILSTIVSEMVQHVYYVDMNIKLDGDIVMEPAIEATDDNSNGWIATFKMKVPMRYTPCNSPIQPIAGWTSSLSNNTFEYRLVGPQGPQGFQGNDGTGGDGATGAQGPQGNDGSNGSQGPQGNDGSNGSQGFQGFQGDFGIDGSNALRWTYQLDGSSAPSSGLFTTTGASFSSVQTFYIAEDNLYGINCLDWLTEIQLALDLGKFVDLKITNVLSPYEYGIYRVKFSSYAVKVLQVSILEVLNSSGGAINVGDYSISYVESGAPGETGPQGEIGLQGFQGNQGTNGTIGSNGATGTQGPQGFQGLGTTGPQGSSSSGALNINQTSHGFTSSNVLHHNGTIYAKAQADTIPTSEVVGIVTSVTDVDNFVLTTSGNITLSGLTAGQVYFLSPTTSGLYTTTEPTTSGQISKPLFISISTTIAVWINMRGILQP